MLAEETHKSPLRLRQLAARQNSSTHLRRMGGLSETARAVNRAKTCALIHRPATRTASNTAETLASRKRFVLVSISMGRDEGDSSPDPGRKAQSNVRRHDSANTELHLDRLHRP